MKPEPNSLLMFFKLMSWSVTWVYLSLSEDEVNSFFPLYCPVKFSIDPVSALKLDWLQATAGAWIIYRLVPLHWHKRDTLPSMPWLVRAKRELKSNLKNFFYVLSNEDILSVGFNDFANIQSAFFRSQKGHRRPRESRREKHRREATLSNYWFPIPDMLFA